MTTNRTLSQFLASLADADHPDDLFITVEATIHGETVGLFECGSEEAFDWQGELESVQRMSDLNAGAASRANFTIASLESERDFLRSVVSGLIAPTGDAP